MHHSSAAHRAAPPWLRDQPFEDVPLGRLKSGKEAEVFLVERRYDGGGPGDRVMLAHKRYRPRRPARGELRELGFVNSTAYRHDAVYRAGWFLGSRDRRAVAHKTAHGRDVIERTWPVVELDMLRRAWRAGASVPYPVELTGDGVLMEFIGDHETAAPRLVQARLTPDEVPDAWAQLLCSLRALAGAGIVHADLSPFNLLWWEGRLVVIDLPQAVDVTTNADALELLHRDLVRTATWFERRGLAIDVEAIYAELVALTF